MTGFILYDCKIHYWLFSFFSINGPCFYRNMQVYVEPCSTICPFVHFWKCIPLYEHHRIPVQIFSVAHRLWRSPKWSLLTQGMQKLWYLTVCKIHLGLTDDMKNTFNPFLKRTVHPKINYLHTLVQMESWVTCLSSQNLSGVSQQKKHCSILLTNSSTGELVSKCKKNPRKFPKWLQTSRFRSHEIPNWFEKTAFTPSMFTRACH